MKKEFHTLYKICKNAKSFLLVAHSRPDPDAIGSTTALSQFLLKQGKSVTITCRDSFSDTFSEFLPNTLIIPSNLIIVTDFDVIIGCDNIDIGFDKILKRCNSNQITVGIDHHKQTALSPDLLITDPNASSTCEILYDFFTYIQYTPSKIESQALIIGILGDTRIFHNPNTTPHVIEIVSQLIKHGAPFTKIAMNFLKKHHYILHLWGSALKNSQKISPDGAIVAAITSKELSSYKIPQNTIKEELKEVASLLSSIPKIPFALVLIQINKSTVKGSIRAEKNSNVDTTKIASLFGGGGHTLASGFEVTGTLVQKNSVWQVV